MEIVLTGRMFSAKEAEDWGLISRVVSDKHEETLQEAISVAEKIASKGKISVQAAKEAVNHGKMSHCCFFRVIGAVALTAKLICTSITILQPSSCHFIKA